jgi:hypothetical protein
VPEAVNTAREAVGLVQSPSHGLLVCLRHRLRQAGFADFKT